MAMAMAMPKLTLLPLPRNHTHPLIWCVSIILCLVLGIVVLVGAVTLIGYLAIKPKVAEISIHRANIDALVFSQPDVMYVQITFVVRALNDNEKAYASFYDTKLALSFEGQKLDDLVASTFDVKANHSVEFNYHGRSFSFRLTSQEVETVNMRGKIGFEFKVTTMTRWRVWRVGSVKSMLNVDCTVGLPIDRSTVYPRGCSSRSKNKK